MYKKILLAALIAALMMFAGCRKPSGTPTEPSEGLIPETGISETMGNGEETAAPTEYGPSETRAPQENEESGAQPEEGTLPPGVDVSLGVVEGEESGDIDEDFEDVPSVEQPTEKPADPTEQPEGDSVVDGDFDITTLTYEMYMAMSGEDQKKVIDMFSTPEDFVKWFKAVEAQYKAEHPDIEIGDGNINAGEIKP